MEPGGKTAPGYANLRRLAGLVSQGMASTLSMQGRPYPHFQLPLFRVTRSPVWEGGQGAGDKPSKGVIVMFSSSGRRTSSRQSSPILAVEMSRRAASTVGALEGPVVLPIFLLEVAGRQGFQQILLGDQPAQSPYSSTTSTVLLEWVRKWLAAQAVEGLRRQAAVRVSAARSMGSRAM